MKSFAYLMFLSLAVTGCVTAEKAPETGGLSSGQTAQAKAYPIDWCIISGEKLGSMGDPVVRTYQGREIKFCCKHCIEEFEMQPALYIARVDSAAAGTLRQPS